MAGAGRAGARGRTGIAGALVVAAHEDVDGGELVRDALGGDAVLALVVLVATPLDPAGSRLRTSEGPLRKGIRATDMAASCSPRWRCWRRHGATHRGPSRRAGRPAAGAAAGAGGRGRRTGGDAPGRSLRWPAERASARPVRRWPASASPMRCAGRARRSPRSPSWSRPARSPSSRRRTARRCAPAPPTRRRSWCRSTRG